jgi:alkane 1-monooxygenase
MHDSAVNGLNICLCSSINASFVIAESVVRKTGRKCCVIFTYGHFTIEHNRGHHVRVATPEDPASARYGESFWRFLPRTIVGSYISA